MSFRVRDVTLQAEARLADGRLTLVSPEGAVTWEARHVGGAQWALRRGDDVQVAFVARDRAGTWVHVDGRAWLVERAEDRPGSGASGGGTVVAPMTGRVLEVLVAEGAAVEEGQPLLVLSAMKMRLEIKSPRRGLVARLPVTAGEQVEGGAVLAVVEAAPA